MVSMANTVHINYILATNREKSMKEFSANANLAKESCKGLTKHGDDYSEKYDPSYFSWNSRVVSFDLFGLERGHRPTDFLAGFQELHQNDCAITIHAGEDDSADSIREAVYAAFTQRIGHGLSLREDKGLLRTVRERHIAVELCPVSNILTNGKYRLPGDVIRQHFEELRRIDQQRKKALEGVKDKKKREERRNSKGV